MQIQDITRFLEAKFPLQLQESYDNSGLIYGRPEQEVKGVLVTLDVTEAIVEEAIENNCNLIIAHHPVVFKGLKRFNGSNFVERVLERCIQNGIALYAIHTNLDNHLEGVNAKIAQKLGLQDCRILRPMQAQLFKLEVYVPKADFEGLDAAILGAGAGQIGNYTDCHFRTLGTGTFRPNEKANPYLGSAGQREEVSELKLEYIVEAHRVNAVLTAMRSAHPYEEVAYQLLATQNQHQSIGAGLVGTLAEPADALSFLNELKQKFNCGVIRYTQLLPKKIEKVALCGGSGSFLLPDAIKAKADIYITADFKYHEFFDAEEQLVIADIGHYESEQFTSELLAEQLTEKFPNFAVRLTKLNTNPVNYL
ncbi:MAG: Nif3-like dinuclear metal center hexameric protein [Crocinitomicaceae bacterium]|nr:Nif3-like dinuclear metal center hexameric protein [Crocinitomicaceae bacterium]MDP4724019.1 Nif3-like dinuclear metal center hexameric protein [Crocinitomicaceae bacterium]MDP4807019.1 Nif3-like dinuclear metal center hexameric protein [Crocinitomicaceae bacterium]MDP5043125.1 Nif3-like dinuclear metal center hexameric protein [Crocinitomicaceae bacterium]